MLMSGQHTASVGNTIVYIYTYHHIWQYIYICIYDIYLFSSIRLQQIGLVKMKMTVFEGFLQETIIMLSLVAQVDFLRGAKFEADDRRLMFRGLGGWEIMRVAPTISNRR